MTPAQFERVERLFDAACRLPANDREHFVAEAAGDDTTVLAAVRALLAEDARSAADTLAARLAALRGQPELRHRLIAGLVAADAGLPLPAESLAEGPGTDLGPYRLVRQLGEGGFGVVFLAAQEKPVARQVALKIIKLGMDTKQVVARFEQERQALALMDHPHIARVLDAGATATGRPYFVMDLVNGAPLVAYCDREQLTIEQRLALFAQVCSAVQHAHGKGIIHRDLKPSNILVADGDGAPQVKVIDFGIAKATAQKLSAATVLTEHLQVIGTLLYMSPEQAAGSLDIDTRTDIYSLGVLLYELLVGTTPFDEHTVGRAMFGELQRLIREVDPPRPSTRLSSAGDVLAGIAERRRIEPRRLTTRLRGDLDWIVMRALEKDRTRRYETASDLAADLQRYLHGEAVVAAPPSASYRLRKFVRRNRALVSAGVATGTTLLVGVIAFAWQADVAAQERDRALLAQRAEAEQRGIAEASARAETTARKRAEAINEFVTNALRSADPRHGGRQGMLVVDAMQNATRMLDDDALREQPEVASRLLQTIAEILSDHGRGDQAQPLAERALAIERRLHPGNHIDIAASLRTLGYVLANAGRPEAALPLQTEALAMLRELFPGDHDDVSTALNNLATTFESIGRYAEAEPLLREALAMTERLNGKDHPDVAGTMTSLAAALEALGRVADAEAMLRDAQARLQRSTHADHPNRVANANNLGHLLWATGRAAEAEPLFAAALASNRRMYAGDHPDTATSLCNLAAAHEKQQQFATAEPLRREALQMSQNLYPDGHPQTADVLQSLGDGLERQGKLEPAVAFFEQAAALERRLGNVPGCLANQLDVGRLLLDLDRAAAAEPVLSECARELRQQYSGDRPELVSVLILLGRAQLGVDKPAEAAPTFATALAMHARLKPEPTPTMARLHWFVGMARLRAGTPAAALPEFEQAVAIGSAKLPPDDKRLAEYREALADCRRALAK
jgi:serine/threonine protein kinase